MNREVSIILAILGITLVGHAADTVRMPEGRACWEISVEPANPLAAAADAPAVPGIRKIKKVEVAQDENFRRDQVTFSDGSQTEYWRIKGFWVIPDTHGDLRTTPASGWSDFYQDWRAFNGDQLQSLSLDGPSKPGEIKGITCQVFESFSIFNPRSSRLPKETPAKAKTLLWLDPASRYPIAVREGNRLYAFKFKEDAEQPVLTPPEIYLKAQEEHAKLVPPPKNKPK